MSFNCGYAQWCSGVILGYVLQDHSQQDLGDHKCQGFNLAQAYARPALPTVLSIQPHIFLVFQIQIKYHFIQEVFLDYSDLWMFSYSGVLAFIILLYNIECEAVLQVRFTSGYHHPLRFYNERLFVLVKEMFRNNQTQLLDIFPYHLLWMSPNHSLSPFFFPSLSFSYLIT